MDKLPTHEIMQQMAKIATEQATTSIAQKARDFAYVLPDGLTGQEALIAFAEAIEQTNTKSFPKGEKQ